MLSLSLLTRVVALATVLSASDRALSQCGLDSNVGVNLSLTDDSVSAAQPLGFAFPFAGVSYDTVYVSSNGFLYLFDSAGSVAPPTGSGCCNGTSATLLSSTSPMICGCWQDLNPASGGSVHFNAVSSSRALITWFQVPEYGRSNLVTIQIGLSSNGRIDLFVDAASMNEAHTALTGWSPGNGATNPGGTDLSSVPFSTNSATLYELFAANLFDLGGVTLTAMPTSPSSWLVASGIGCAIAAPNGLGCPQPCDTYELFQASAFDLSANSLRFTAQPDGSYLVSQCSSNCFDATFANNLNLTDDSLAVGMNLGFTFPYCGGSTTSVDVCSNGFVWLVSGSSTSADFSPTEAEFLNNPARLAPLWMDLNPFAGGGVYFDARPGVALVTWDQVPAFGVTGSSNTLQLQIFPNGDFLYTWNNALNNQTTGDSLAITGFTQGNVSTANTIDLSTSWPYRTGNGQPLFLANQRGSQPVLGSNFVLEVSRIRTGTIGGTLTIGATNPNLDLGFLGLTGCRLLASLDVSIAFAPVQPITPLPLRVPNVNSLVGRTLFTQAVMVDPSLARTIPVYVSNGVGLTFGR